MDLKPENHKKYIDSLESLTLKDDSPNIITIFCDDLGYADISCFGATTIQTPNIDRLSKEGVEFTNFYSSSPVCSPSRAGLLTGRIPTRMHINFVFFPRKTIINYLLKFFRAFKGIKGILEDEVTLAEVLQKVGYKTGLIGKWHLGDIPPHLPTNKGFKFFYGSYYSNDMKPYAIYRNDNIEIPAPANQEELTKNLTKEAVSFIEKNKEKPFFLHYCQPFPHHPLHASDDFKNTSKAGVYGDAVQEVDWSIGKIIETLEKHNLREKTIILFTSDNGPWHEGNPGYHRGRKGLTFEGGQRVPMLANWPGKIKPDTKVNAASMNTDIFPTILDLLDIPLPTDRIIDGKSILPLLRGESSVSPHDVLYYFWGRKLQAIRMGKWKYHVKHRSDNAAYFFGKFGPYLFNLEEDQNESYNQIPHYPEQAEKMSKKINEMKLSMEKNIRGWKK
ncbi:MAG: sulfatase [archaeon]|nr:sulfatase [archaeon]